MDNSYVDLEGKRFGKLTAIRKTKPHVTSGGRYVTMWECVCDCGNKTTVSTQKLRKGHTTSCGCNKKNNKGGRFNDLTGRKFGRLTVIRYLQEEERETKRKCWLCQCECGTVKGFNINKLTSGNTVSCSCAKSERIGNLNKKYRNQNKRLYTIYRAMLERCFDEDNEEYHNYGGRGITVCEEWRDNFDDFADWAMTNGYDEHAPRGQCTLDRKDNNKGYSPDNCRWITNKEQQNNRRYHIHILHDGKEYTLSQLARKLNIPYMYMWHRYVEKGMNIEKIISNYTAEK